MKSLQEFFSENPRAALGFSGGVDSAYLLYAGLRWGAEVAPYYVKTDFQPEFEFLDACRLCEELGVKMRVIELDILAWQNIRENPAGRCYYCKQRLFGALKDRAAEDGFSLLIDGTNASDDAGDRPGMRALKELSVRSPLRECGLTKPEIRKRSKAAGLFTWDKPAYACLATRVPVGRELSKEELGRIEKAEDRLAGLGFRDFRVRILEGSGGAKLQLKEDQLHMAISGRREILQALGPLFPQVTVDLQAR